MPTERDPERDALEAEQLLNNEFLTAILADLERDAFEGALAAKLTDDAARAAALGEVRAIRSFSAKLQLAIQQAKARARQPRGIV